LRFFVLSLLRAHYRTKPADLRAAWSKSGCKFRKELALGQSGLPLQAYSQAQREPESAGN
jgi:hypothetical protein